tara:strand:+ start:167 stop:427 length:261 start_codon:yes stop_codon:yes gene_type:complete
MALEKATLVDKIEVLEMGQIQIRTATRIKEDGKVISQSFTRSIVVPGDDLSGQDARVTAIANATWTSEVVSAYEALIAKQKAGSLV